VRSAAQECWLQLSSMVEQPVTEKPTTHSRGASDGSAADRRNLLDRRRALEFGAKLSVAASDVREVLDAQCHGLTVLQRHIELLRTPTAPPVQHQHALDQLRQAHQKLESLHEGARAALEAFARLLTSEPPPTA
jgi:hypothetical protein